MAPSRDNRGVSGVERERGGVISSYAAEELDAKRRLFDKAHSLCIAQQMGRADSCLMGQVNYACDSEAKDAKIMQLLQAAAAFKSSTGPVWLPVQSSSPEVQLAVYGDLAVKRLQKMPQMPQALLDDTIERVRQLGITPAALTYMANEGLLARDAVHSMLQTLGRDRAQAGQQGAGPRRGPAPSSVADEPTSPQHRHAPPAAWDAPRPGRGPVPPPMPPLSPPQAAAHHVAVRAPAAGSYWQGFPSSHPNAPPTSNVAAQVLARSTAGAVKHRPPFSSHPINSIDEHIAQQFLHEDQQALQSWQASLRSSQSHPTNALGTRASASEHHLMSTPMLSRRHASTSDFSSPPNATTAAARSAHRIPQPPRLPPPPQLPAPPGGTAPQPHHHADVEDLIRQLSASRQQLQNSEEVAGLYKLISVLTAERAGLLEAQHHQAGLSPPHDAGPHDARMPDEHAQASLVEYMHRVQLSSPGPHEPPALSHRQDSSAGASFPSETASASSWAIADARSRADSCVMGYNAVMPQHGQLPSDVSSRVMSGPHDGHDDSSGEAPFSPYGSCSIEQSSIGAPSWPLPPHPPPPLHQHLLGAPKPRPHGLNLQTPQWPGAGHGPRPMRSHDHSGSSHLVDSPGGEPLFAPSAGRHSFVRSASNSSSWPSNIDPYNHQTQLNHDSVLADVDDGGPGGARRWPPGPPYGSRGEPYMRTGRSAGRARSRRQQRQPPPRHPYSTIGDGGHVSEPRLFLDSPGGAPGGHPLLSPVRNPTDIFGETSPSYLTHRSDEGPRPPMVEGTRPMSWPPHQQLLLHPPPPMIAPHVEVGFLDPEKSSSSLEQLSISFNKQRILHTQLTEGGRGPGQPQAPPAHCLDGIEPRFSKQLPAGPAYGPPPVPQHPTGPLSGGSQQRRPSGRHSQLDPTWLSRPPGTEARSPPSTDAHHPMFVHAPAPQAPPWQQGAFSEGPAHTMGHLSASHRVTVGAAAPLAQQQRFGGALGLSHGSPEPWASPDAPPADVPDWGLSVSTPHSASSFASLQDLESALQQGLQHAQRENVLVGQDLVDAMNEAAQSPLASPTHARSQHSHHSQHFQWTPSAAAAPADPAPAPFADRYPHSPPPPAPPRT